MTTPELKTDPILTREQIKKYWPRQADEGVHTASASALIILAASTVVLSPKEMEIYHVTPTKKAEAGQALVKLSDDYPDAVRAALAELDKQGKTLSSEWKLIRDQRDKPRSQNSGIVSYMGDEVTEQKTSSLYQSESLHSLPNHKKKFPGNSQSH